MSATQHNNNTKPLVEVDGSGGHTPYVRLGTGSAVMGTVGIDQTTPGTTNGVSVLPTTSGGLASYRNLDLGTTGQVVKNAAGQLYGYYVANNATSARFLKIYDKATAPTGSNTPVFTYQLPAGSAGHRSIPNGVAFAVGISVRATTVIADNDATAPATNDVVVNLEYK